MLCLTLVQPFGTKPDTLKRSNNLNIFKNNFKKYILKELENSSISF